MLNTKDLHEFTEVTEQQIMDKASQYLVNHKYRREECSIFHLFNSLYCNLYNIESVKTFKCVQQVNYAGTSSTIFIDLML